MGKNLIESVMGAVVLLVAAFFLIFAYSNSNLRAVKGYPINARFSSIGGLARGSDVRINGVKVGTVAEQHLDPGTFAAVVVMNLAPEIKLPADTVASISAEGLLGGKYVRLDPGHAQETIPVGGSIHNTRDFKSVEELVADIIFLATDNSGKKDKAAIPAPKPAGEAKPPSDPPDLGPNLTAPAAKPANGKPQR